MISVPQTNHISRVLTCSISNIFGNKLITQPKLLNFLQWRNQIEMTWKCFSFLQTKTFSTPPAPSMLHNKQHTLHYNQTGKRTSTNITQTERKGEENLYPGNDHLFKDYCIIKTPADAIVFLLYFVFLCLSFLYFLFCFFFFHDFEVKAK